MARICAATASVADRSVGKPERAAGDEAERAERADERAGERRGPADAAEIRRRRAPPERQAREEAQVFDDVADEPAGRRREALRHAAHRKVAAAASAMAVCPYSSRPHCQTSARAAPTSFGARAMIWLLIGPIT